MKRLKKLKFTALVLVFALLFTSIQPAAWVEAAAGSAGQAADGTEEPGADIHNPENGVWSYIYFGSYPQTEVAGDDLTDAIKNASYDANGDATVDGEKYHRIYTRRYPAGILNESDGTDEYFYYKWEPIRWKVLQKTEDALLVMADVGLDYIPYHTAETAVTWDKSWIRDWLNSENTDTLYDSGSYIKNNYFSYSFYLCENGNEGYRHYLKDDKQEKVHSFYTTAFDDAQRAAITAQGNDKLFLLSAEDVKNASYGFGTAEKLPARQLSISEYAKKKSWFASESAWWLRSDDAPYATIVGSGGDIISQSEYFKVNDYSMACVPAMYISLSSDQWVSEAAQLAGYKEDALNTLYAFQTSKYQTAEAVSMLKAVKESRDAINQAKDNAAVDNALAAAKAKIGGLKTGVEANWEEAIAAGDSLNPVHHHDTSMMTAADTDLDTLRSEENKDYTDWHYVYFGIYPQAKVTDQRIIKGLASFEVRGEFEGKKYWRDSGYWYEYAPIKWRILQVEDNQLFLAADQMLDVFRMGGTTTKAWNDSKLKEWMNTDATNATWFLPKAFSEEEQNAIVPYEIDGTENKVYVLSYDDVKNEAYGFCSAVTVNSNSRSRQMRATDWALASGRTEENTPCWTRTYYDAVSKFRSITATGAMGTYSAGSIGGVVPALRLSLDKKYAPYWSMSEPTSDADIKAILDAMDGLETLYREEDYSAAQWAKVQESLDGMLERMIEGAGEQEIADIVEETKQELDEIPNKQQEEQSALQAAKDAAKAELEAYREDNDKYTEEQQQEREGIITTGITAIEAAQDADAVTAALNKAKEDLAKIVPGGGEEDPKIPPTLEEELRNRTFQTIDDETQRMYSESYELTIEVFADIRCGAADIALKYLQQMNLPTDKVDIFSIDNSGASKEKVQSHVGQLNTPDITHCYDAEVVSNGNSQAELDMRSYSYYYSDGIPGTPLYVFRDSTGKILNVTAGWRDTEELTEILDSIGYIHLVTGGEKPVSTTIEAEFEVTYCQTEARQMLSRINDLRTGEDAWEWNETDTEKIFHTDLGELTYDYELEKVAMQRAAELVAAYSHTRPDETSCFTAYPSAFDNMSKGENIAIGTGSFTEERAFTGWREEDKPYSGQGHRRNMLNEGFRTVGIAHVTYNGCHYWVQEFGGNVVSDEETPANDSKTTIKVSISKNAISEQELKAETETMEMKEGESQPFPQVYNTVRTNETWVYAPSLEFPVTAKWSVSSGGDVVSISGGTFQALKEGNTRVTASYNGGTTEIQVIVAGVPTKEEYEEKLKEYEGKLADYGETEKGELEELLQTIKEELEAALAEDDMDAANAALARMEEALKEKAAGKKEDAKQELGQIQGSITEDQELDESQKAEIEEALREAEAAIENAKDATAVKEELAKVKDKIEEIKAKGQELKQAQGEALNELNALEKKLGDYRTAEQQKIREAIETARNAIAEAKDADEVRSALAAANAVFQKQPTDAELTKKEKEENQNQNNNKNLVKKITISAPSKKIAAKKKVALTANVTPANAKDRRVKWSVDNQSYASVTQKGVVTMKKAGAGKSVKVTATALDGSGQKATITISIMKSAVKSIKLGAAKTVRAGKTLKVKATVNVTNKKAKANKTLKWTTSNKKYATVNAKGVVSAKKAGKGKKVKITATATDGTNKKATVTIKIK